MTNLFKFAASVSLLLLVTAFTSLEAQTTYFAGASSGTGNTGTYVTGVGYFTLNNSNSGTGNAGFGAFAVSRNTTGFYNTGIGYASMYYNSNGVNNTALGAFSLYSNTSGSNNTGIGRDALNLNTSGTANIAMGHQALRNNTGGYSNSALGYGAIYANITGIQNTAVGDSALYRNTYGSQNTAVGAFALAANTEESANSAFGFSALAKSIGGFGNTATGAYALGNTTYSLANNAYGYFALNNSTGSNNNAFGYNALRFNTTGNSNVGMGMEAMIQNTTGSNNVAIGASASYASTLINNSVFVGAQADASVNNLTNAIAIGYNAKINASNKAVIGNSSVTSIGGQVGWTTYSDMRLKTNINKSKLGLDFILSLNPVTYNYKAEGQKGILYTGLIAQEVDEAAKKAGIEFSGIDKNGEYWGIRYAELTVPLIKGMQEMNAESQQLKEQVTKMQAAINDLKEAIKTNTKQLKTYNSVLFQNQPNPFNQSTVISYQLASNEKTATIVIRNMNGSVVKEVKIYEMAGGKITINANELSAGTYTYSLLEKGAVVDTKLMVITK